MQSIVLWRVKEDGSSLRASTVISVDQAETEEKLERLLLRSPGLLSEGLVLVGRQNETAGGPLDLLGIDADGRLVVFELKRGTLTRDAVAQVLDYVSFLDELDGDQRAQHIQENSGRHGVERIDDFRAWYQERFSGSADAFKQTPRAVLVGLGVDDRARRMVEFLADRDVDITLVTFHAFHDGQELLLARQVNVSPQERVSTTGRSYTKEENQSLLNENAGKAGCKALLEEVKDAICGALPAAYVWPNATCYGIYLPETTETGRTSNRNYVSVYVDAKHPGTIQLAWQDRALRIAADALGAAAKEAGAKPPVSGRTYSASLGLEAWRKSAVLWVAAAAAVWTVYDRARNEAAATPGEPGER